MNREMEEQEEEINKIIEEVNKSIETQTNLTSKILLSDKYNKTIDSYKHLGNNITEAFKKFLDEENIDYLEVYSRVKDFDSFSNKSNKYKDPFNEIEDICGIRVICYYASDIDKISKIINNEFNVIEQQDISDRFNVNEFGYRSHHFIVKIKDSWTAAPNYRGLENFKAEIQVRTISMHAWAEVEHKLNYKNVNEIPHKFKRKISQLSSKFEEIDEQFDALRTGIEEYQNEITQKIKETNSFDLEQEFNVETLEAFLKFNYPEIEWKRHYYSIIFKLLKFSKIDLFIIQKSINKVKPFYSDMYKDVLETDNGLLKSNLRGDIFWLTMDVTNDDFFKEREYHTTKNCQKLVSKWREKIMEE